MKIKRNYQFVQFLLDLFGLFLLYPIIMSVVEAIGKLLNDNRIAVERHGPDVGQLNPYPLIIWGVLALLIK